MLDFLFTCGQVLCLIGYLYGAYLVIRYGDTFKSIEDPKRKQSAPNPEVDDQLSRDRDRGYYL